MWVDHLVAELRVSVQQLLTFVYADRGGEIRDGRIGRLSSMAASIELDAVPTMSPAVRRKLRARDLDCWERWTS